MSREPVEALVIGAGAAGLAAALELRRRGCEVLVVDAGDRPGGVMRTGVRHGYRFEYGPNTFQLKAPALALLRRTGLESTLLRASPASRRRWLYHEGRLVPVPAGPLALARSPLLSARGKLRLLAEPFVRRGDASEESVAQFVRRRLGDEALERLVAPFLVGVYAGDAERLGADAVFPALVEMERRSGSLVGGALPALLRRREARGLPGIWSAREGMGGLARGLAEDLGEAICLRTRARSLAWSGEGWHVSLEHAELVARRLVLATDAATAAELLRGVDPDAAELLARIEYAPVVSLALPVDPHRARQPLEGFGFLVPRAAELDLLGALFMSRLFQHRAPEGRVLVQALIGGMRWPGAVDAAEEQILERVAEGLERAIGLSELPAPLSLQRWPRAVPQPAPGHRLRIEKAQRWLQVHPGLALAGGYVAGVSVADTLASGIHAASLV